MTDSQIAKVGTHSKHILTKVKMPPYPHTHTKNNVIQSNSSSSTTIADKKYTQATAPSNPEEERI